MIHLIERALPARLHRALLPAAHTMRHFWRMLRKVPLRGCAVVIEDDGGSILLLRHSYGPKVWALPGGGIAKGEQPAAAAKREMKEELDLSLDKISAVGTVENEISRSPHAVHLFSARTGQAARPDRREVLEARFFPKGSLPEPLSPTTRECLALWTAKSD